MLVKRNHTKPDSKSVIYLTKTGIQLLVDKDDYERIANYTWYIRRARGVNYAFRKKTTKGKEFLVFMHRQIMHCPNDKVVHHINHNGLDNRKENLLLLTPEQHKEIHKFT